MASPLHGQSALDATLTPAHVSSNALHVAQYVWDPDLLDWVRQTGPGSGGAGATPTDLCTRLVTSGTTSYLGKALPGSAEASAVWQVKRIQTGPLAIQFADGNANFDNIWSNHASLSYS